MTIRAVIFDLGGVLVRTENRASRERLAARLGMTYDDLSHLIFEGESGLLATLGRISTQEHWETVRAALNLSPEEFPSVLVDFWGGDALDNVLVEYIRSLRPQYKTALLSNAWDDLRQALTYEWKIADVFDELIISAEVGMAKPEAQIYQLALDRLSVSPPEAVFVDDFLHNVDAARAVGMFAVHFQSSEQVQVELDQLLNK